MIEQKKIRRSGVHLKSQLMLMPAKIKSASESCSESSEVEKNEIIKEKTVNPRRQEPESECSVSADGQHWNVESETEPSVV